MVDLADHDLFECEQCQNVLDIEDSHKRHDAYLCPECVELVDGLPPAGTRVRLTHEIWRYPHFIAEKGMVGTVVESDRELFAVRMDRTIPGSEEWQNEVHWYPRNCNEWPFEDIAVLGHSRRFLSFLRNTLRGEHA